jgi:hypothetical protein
VIHDCGNEGLEVFIAAAAVPIQIVWGEAPVLILTTVLRAAIRITIAAPKILPALAVRCIELRRPHKIVKRFHMMFLRAFKLPVEETPIVFSRPFFNLSPTHSGVMQPDRAESKFRPESEVLVIVHMHAEEIGGGLSQTQAGYSHNYEREPRPSMNKSHDNPSGVDY